MYDFKTKQSFINIHAIKKLAIITAVIEDSFNCPTMQVDVRSWKTAIFGTSKVKKNYSEVYIKQKYDIIVNNDLADAICIAETGLYFPEKLKEIK
jgi:Holliday junction resolvasome RuvABC endonuclease subunit